MIFGFLDPQANVVNAQVCKQWLDIAMDVLWKDVSSLYRLVRLLSPLKSVGDKNYEFESLPDANAWKRFEKYARRVRRLKYHAASERRLNQTVFDDIARTRRRLEIFPNLRILDWNAPLGMCSLFMHNGVKKFVVHLPAQPLQHFFQDIVDRMPNLSTLNICSVVPVRDIEEDLAHFLRQLPKLEKVTFPRFYLTTRIAEAMSHSDCLSSLDFQYNDDQGVGDFQDIASFRPAFTEGAFPALYDLSLTASFDDTARFIKAPFSPTNLTQFYVDSGPVSEPVDSVHRLISAVSQHCQLVEEVYLVSARRPCRMDPTTEDDSGSNITLEMFKPLFKIPKLTCFEFSHQYPLLLTQQDITVFASSCPAIETLLLNAEPIYLTQSTLTLEALVPLARHCPQLKHLALFMDATQVPELTPMTPFKSLRQLMVGISIIDDEAGPALYLSHLLPPGCDVERGVTWEDCEDTDEALCEALYEIVRERYELWTGVKRMVPMLSMLRLQERQRTHQMERELEDLRMRTAVLRDSTALGVRLDLSTCLLI
ncbi:hypothetical protein HYPSUDRAFT_128584 [Hypholoma sublateritium FD-334 SS-4]|uniref:F-box domain-containing protein n=1 Tax=Hypholoma sublateritium (strain FD-334 SS-4) TaxID=945553 RepID=A0A0D2MXF4_HYPSF|nr:hypothetical protein HYPSUDRAFT_128584 [Hypholoma sublateritium FD-334 SS-4]